jgi:hypothetical protein
MGDTPTDYTLMKLDKIEDLVRELKHLLLAQAEAPTATAPTMTGIVSSRLEKWIFSLKPLAVMLSVAGRQTINTLVIIYMARGGSLGPMEPYIRYLIGIP